MYVAPYQWNRKRDVLLQLRGSIDELRAIVPPKPGQVGSTDYTPIRDERVHSSPCGPKSVADFHRAIHGGAVGSTGRDELDGMISMQDSRNYQVKFAHSDLAFQNILVSVDEPIQN